MSSLPSTPGTVKLSQTVCTETYDSIGLERAVQNLLWDYLKAPSGHADNRCTGWGDKTLRGLTLSVRRIVHDSETPKGGVR